MYLGKTGRLELVSKAFAGIDIVIPYAPDLLLHRHKSHSNEQKWNTRVVFGRGGRRKRSGLHELWRGVTGELAPKAAALNQPEIISRFTTCDADMSCIIRRLLAPSLPLVMCVSEGRP